MSNLSLSLKSLLFALLAVVIIPSAFARVDINSATAKELQTVKNIGAAKAKAIVDYRKANGPFKSVNALEKVPGFSKKAVSSIKGELSVGKKKATKKKKSERKKKSSAKVNINTANKKTLMGLKGVGKKKAEAIIQYRKKSGKFESVSELENVKGFSKKTVKRLKSNVTVSK